MPVDFIDRAGILKVDVPLFPARLRRAHLRVFEVFVRLRRTKTSNTLKKKLASEPSQLSEQLLRSLVDRDWIHVDLRDFPWEESSHK